MNTIARVLAALSLLVVVSACGTDTSPAGSSGPADSSSSGTGAGPTTSPGPTGATSGAGVVAVALNRSGGLKPTTVSRVFAADQPPPPGFTAADVKAALRAASQFATSEAKLAPMPSNVCCDRYSYRVTITWADGTSKTYTTVDGLPQPQPFDALLSALA